MLLAAPAAPGAVAPTAPPEKAIAVDVRSAPLGEVLDRASAAAGARLSATGPAGDQRVTLYAARTTAGELRDALRDLLRLRVTRHGAEEAARDTLSLDPSLAAQAEGWRLRQADTMLRAVVRAADAYTTGQEAATVRATRERFDQAHPEFPEAARAAIDINYLRQSLLLAPLPPMARGQLTRSGWLSFPLEWLSPGQQMLLAAFARGGPGRAGVDETPWQSGVTGARAQYRLLYGDRWTDQMLVMQVGTPGAWTTAMLPSILFRQRDAASLYPQAATLPDDPDVWRRLPPRFEMAGKDWDSVLTQLAATMQIRLAADSYARPWLFNTDRPLPELAGIPLRDALERLCRERGYFWWKQNGWYMLRSRNWVEESRVAVPDRLLRDWLASARASGALAEADLLQMASLTDEQLLTLNMRCRAPDDLQFLGEGFDPDEAALFSNALLLYRGLPPAQRELSLTGDLPALWLPPAQQNLFAAIAAQTGTPLLSEEAESWSFRLRQEFTGIPTTPSKTGAGARERVDGQIIAEWRFGPGEVVRARISLNDRSLHQKSDPMNPPDAR